MTNPEENYTGECTRDLYRDFEAHLEKKSFQFLGQGSFRKAYVYEDIVIKVPICTDGIVDNHIEHMAYHRYWNRPTPEGIFLMPCRLLRNGCLMMKRTEDPVIWRDFPAWTKLIDGVQCGYYRDRVVAYDYALDLTDRFRWEGELGLKSHFFNSKGWRKRRKHLNEFLTSQGR